MLKRTSDFAHRAVVCAGLVIFIAGAYPIWASTYYVSPSGDDKSDGKTAGSAWRTVTAAAARARAGDTVFIKAGNYSKDEVLIRNSGTEERPITFEGYTREPGDRPFPDYEPGDDLDPAVMPILDGEGGTKNAIYLRNQSHIRIRNLGIKRYREMGVFALDCSHVAIENVVVTDIYKTEGHTYGVGVYFIGGERNSIRNSIATNGSGNNIAGMHSNYLVIENCRTYGTLEDRLLRPDYYIVIGDSHDCIIRDCLAYNLHPNNGCGHGIGIKDQARPTGYPYPHSRNNRVINCTVYNSGEHLWVAHGAHHNEFINCRAFSDWRNMEQRWSQGINVREGAHHNTFRNCVIVGARFAAAFGDSVEGPKAPDGSPIPQTSHNNTFVDCVFADAQVGFEMWNNRHSLFKNCVVTGVDTTLFEYWYKTTGYNLFEDTTIADVRGAYAKSHSGQEPDTGFRSCDFWRNGFKLPAGAKGEGRAEDQAEKLRVEQALCGAAPIVDSLDGRGPLVAYDFAWIPDAETGAAATVKLADGEGHRQVALEADGGQLSSGWLGVNVGTLCRPCTVYASDGKKLECWECGDYVLFRAEKPGVWKITELPLKGTLAIPGQFACKRFQVKFAKGLHTQLVFEHLPESKMYRFESENAKADDEAELTVHVGKPKEGVGVTGDGEPCDRFKRHGEHLIIRGVRPNVTYRIGKMGPKPVMDGL